MENTTAIVFLCLGTLLCAAEVFIPSFVLFPIGIGAIGAGIASWLSLSLPWSIFIWSLTSIGFWLGMKNLFHGNPKDDYKSGVQALIGKTGSVSEEISSRKSTGRIKIYGDEWQVIMKDGDTEIPVGEKVVVTGTEGNKLICIKKS